MNSCGHPGESFVWADEANAAITKSARPLCRDCYTARHGLPREFRRPTDADLFRFNRDRPDAPATLGVHNILLNGDHPDRAAMRGRYRVESGLVVLAPPTEEQT